MLILHRTFNRLEFTKKNLIYINDYKLLIRDIYINENKFTIYFHLFDGDSFIKTLTINDYESIEIFPNVYLCISSIRHILCYDTNDFYIVVYGIDAPKNFSITREEIIKKWQIRMLELEY